ncbi:MAG TPA: hypothetical protein VF640_02540 [Acidimicrobiales bacterium]
MIEAADAELVGWLSPVLDGAVVTFAPPAPRRDGAGLSVYLVELYDVPATRGLARQAQVGLRYLVTAWAETHELAHRLLGRALAAAVDRPDVEVQVDPPGFELWFSLGVKPQACFFIRVVARQRAGPANAWRG